VENDRIESVKSVRQARKRETLWEKIYRKGKFWGWRRGSSDGWWIDERDETGTRVRVTAETGTDD